MEEYFENEQLTEENFDGVMYGEPFEPPITEEQIVENQIIEQPIKVYIKVNSNNEVVEINSEIFIGDFTGWIEIDSGFGDKYAHAQSQYLPNSLMSEEGKWNYKYINGKIVEN